MTASRVRPMRPRFLALAAAALAALLVAPAFAQQGGGGPLMLTPPHPTDAPTPQQPAAQAQPSPAGTPAPAATVQPSSAAPAAASPGQAPPSSGVEVNTLSTVNADSVGTLTDQNGGLGIDMWQGTPRSLVEDMLPRIPIGTGSAAMRGLEQRLLLSAATPPESDAPANGTLIATRVGLLATMGDLSGAEALLDATPNHAANADLIRIEADVRFLENDNARACALAAERIRSANSDYWQKAFIFCQALAGQHDKAALGVALLREQGVEDKVFYALVDALAGTGPKTLDAMPQPTPLTLAMARAANVQLPASVTASNQPAILRAVATSPNVPIELRLEAGERAAAAGALPIETLQQLYTAVSFSEADLANPLSRAEAETGPLSRALLYRTALVQTVPTAQAEAVAKALDLARQGDRYASTVRTFLPILKKIPPSAELVWFAPEAVRAFLIADQPELVRSWYGVLRASALFNNDSANAVAALKPLLRLAGSPEVDDWKPEDLDAWWQAASGTPEGRGRAALLYAMMDAFGQAVPDTLWQNLLVGPQQTTTAVPEAPLWFRLRSAAQGGRVGETAMLALIALGDGGPSQADPVTLRDVLSRLVSVKLDADARALAVEAALAAGI